MRLEGLETGREVADGGIRAFLIWLVVTGRKVIVQ